MPHAVERTKPMMSGVMDAPQTHVAATGTSGDRRTVDELYGFVLREMVRISQEDGKTPSDRGWVEITPHAFHEVMLDLPPDEDLTDESLASRRFRGLSSYAPDSATRLLVHEDHLSIVHSEIEPDTEPPPSDPISVEPSPAPVENVQPTMGSVSDEVKES